MNIRQIIREEVKRVFLNKPLNITIISESRKDNKLHLTLDNGGLPFILNDEDGYVNLYKHELRFDNVEKVFDGNATGGDKDSAMLLSLGDNKYVYIGSVVYEFTAEDEIKEFYAKIGNSAVPYPVAVGDKYAYFMLEGEYVDKDDFNKGMDWADKAYGYFYGHLESEKPIRKHKMKGYKKMIDRNIDIESINSK